MCSSSSAQKTQSNEPEAKSSFVTSPATVTTRGIAKRGLCKSSAVTSEKYFVSNWEKCPSLAPMSSTDRRPLGSKRRRSFVRAFSSSLARYFPRFLSTPASRICLRLYLRPNSSSDWSLQIQRKCRVFRTFVEAEAWWCSLPRGEAESFCAPLHAVSARRFMSRYGRVPHFVPATWHSLAVASINADLPSGNAPTARVLRRSSRSNRSNGLFVRKQRQCSRGNA